MRNAVVAIDDQRFYDHHQRRPRALLRAAYVDATSRIVEGGSTIAQQYVKQTYVGGEDRLVRDPECDPSDDGCDYREDVPLGAVAAPASRRRRARPSPSPSQLTTTDRPQGSRRPC